MKTNSVNQPDLIDTDDRVCPLCGYTYTGQVTSCNEGRHGGRLVNHSLTQQYKQVLADIEASKAKPASLHNPLQSNGL